MSTTKSPATRSAKRKRRPSANAFATKKKTKSYIPASSLPLRRQARTIPSFDAPCMGPLSHTRPQIVTYGENLSNPFFTATTESVRTTVRAAAPGKRDTAPARLTKTVRRQASRRGRGWRQHVTGSRMSPCWCGTILTLSALLSLHLMPDKVVGARGRAKSAQEIRAPRTVQYPDQNATRCPARCRRCAR